MDVLGITKKIFTKPKVEYQILFILLFIVAAVSYAPFIHDGGLMGYLVTAAYFMLFYGPLALLGIAWLFIYHYISEFFKAWQNPFAIKFSRGFRFIFYSSVLAMIVGIIQRFVHNAAISILLPDLESYGATSWITAVIFLPINFVIACLGLYGGYILVSALRDYQRMEKERLAALEPPPSQ